MSLTEDGLVYDYWEKDLGRRGTLIEEFPVAGRRIDAVILPDEKPDGQVIRGRAVNLNGKTVILVEAKTNILGRYLAGQTLFAIDLIERHHSPASIRSVALCTLSDEVLAEALKKYDARTEIRPYFQTAPST